jgi:hypothetical protein
MGGLEEVKEEEDSGVSASESKRGRQALLVAMTPK